MQRSVLCSFPTSVPLSFLAVPPFPGVTVDLIENWHGVDSAWADDLCHLAGQLRARRVGGTYWAAQPKLPNSYILVRSAALVEAFSEIDEELPRVLWTDAVAQPVSKLAHSVVTGSSDPWHMLGGARALIGDQWDDVSLIAHLLGVPVYQPAPGGFRRLSSDELDQALKGRLVMGPFVNPFTGDPMSVGETIELCGFWRDLIDRNRGIDGGLGFSFWKRENVGALLWDGERPFRFARSMSDLQTSVGPIAVWRSKVSEEDLAELEAQSRPVIEVEDGFIRSRGLGADCVPPLSITVDRLGAHFDPAQPSELELLLQQGSFDQALLSRAARLREIIVAAGLTKYACGDNAIERASVGRRYILVPGQVEDDRSVLAGGCGLSTNLELLERVREQAPDAHILYKPHPDVVAGHRKGAILERVCLRYADEVVGDAPITSLIAMVDEVHVNTSLAGFEALLRETSVTTYGVPFYAGWGLTTDLGPVPSRRTARRTLDELVAATLLCYPRYLDPATGLPCPPEVVVDRLSAGNASDDRFIVKMRRLQGKFMRSVRSLVE